MGKEKEFRPGHVAFVKEEISDVIAYNKDDGKEYFVDLYPFDEVDVLSKADSGEVLVKIENYGEALIEEKFLKPVTNREKDREELEKELKEKNK